MYLLRKFCICNCIYYDFFESNCSRLLSSIYYKKKVCNCNCIYYIFFEYRAQLCIYIYILYIYIYIYIYIKYNKIDLNKYNQIKLIRKINK